MLSDAWKFVLKGLIVIFHEPLKKGIMQQFLSPEV